jgi:uncharacterized protein (DUF2252 family)
MNAGETSRTKRPETPEPMVAQHTPAEREARGKAARTRSSRESHSMLDVGGERNPVALLEEQALTRVPQLVPIRYGRMLVSPFTFYRGAAAVMAHDLAAMPHSGLTVQLCGDAHLANFGGYASPERELVFDINDFDETHPGPFEWDVKRLAASFEIAARDREFDDSDRRAAVLAAVGAYRHAMLAFAGMRNLEVWYSRLSAAAIEARLAAAHDKTRLKAFERAVAKAHTKDNLKAFARMTEEVDGRPRIASDPPLINPIRDLVDQFGHAEGYENIGQVEQTLRDLFHAYRRSLLRDRRRLLEGFTYCDLAHKVVGVGSVGTRCWIFLLLGRDDGDPLFLQVKEAQQSVLESVLTKSEFDNHGQRVVEGQRLMQSVSDIFLGWVRYPTAQGDVRDFYVRQLWDWKTSVKLEAILPDGLTEYARACGWILARAHARSGDRVAIASYLGKSDVFERALADFAASYADLNERDHASLAAAARDGRITVREGL